MYMNGAWNIIRIHLVRRERLERELYTTHTHTAIVCTSIICGTKLIITLWPVEWMMVEDSGGVGGYCTF